MPVITRSGGGKVTDIWGGAQIRDQHGKMQPLHVGDLVKPGDVILTTQNGIVRISDGANPVAAAKTTEPSDTDRVIAGLNQGDLDVAPGAGLVGGDGGSLSEGFRVGRITEGVTPASIGLPQYEESTIEDLVNEIRAEVVPLGDGIPETPVEPPSPPPPPPPPPVGPPATVSLSASQDFESDSAGYTFIATLSAASQGRTTIVTDQGVITIEDGQTSGSITVGVGSNPDDVYVDPTSLMATITSASGGNFGPINVGTGSAEASIVDTITPVTTSLGTAPPPPAPTLRFALARSFFVDDAPPEAPFSLSADAFAAIETQSTVVPTKLMLSATLSAPSQGDTTITTDLPDGSGGFRELIIADGEMSGSIEIVIDITDDVYIDGYTINITSASGGNFEFIDRSSTSSTTSITIPDPVTPAVVVLTGSTVVEDELAGYTFTATLSDASEGVTTVVTDRGTIYIQDGDTTGSIIVDVGSNPDDVYVDPTSLIATITSATGGNFEDLQIGTSSATAVIEDTVTPVTTSLGTEPLPQAPAPLFRMAFARSFFVEDAAPAEAPVSLSAAAVEDSVTVPEGQRAKFTLSATLSEPSQGETTLVTNWVYPNGELGVITIGDGETFGSIEIEIFNPNDVYLDGFTQTITVTSASGGNFEFIDLSSGSASTTITITDSLVPVIIRLTATLSITEGGYIVYTASLENNASLPDLVTNSPLVIQLDNGTTITIPVGFDSASSEPVPVRADDYYDQGTGTVTATITGTSGGDFERLDYVTFGSASTLVNDDFDTTTVQLLSTRQDGSGNYVVIASIDNAPDESPLVLTLSNGATVTFEVGRTTAESTAVAVPKVGPSATVSVTSAEGGNFEALNTEDTVVAPLDISVDIPVVTPITNPLGLNVEYYGYNDFNPTGGNANRQHLDDGTFGNLDSVADVTALINARNVYYGGGNVVGSTVATQDNATDVRFTATTLDYGRINAVNNSLGTNPDVAAGAGSPITINRTNSELFKFVNKTPASAPIDLRVTLGTPDSDNLGSGPTSGLGKTSDAAMRFTGQAYLNAGLYDIRVTADAGFRLRLDDQTVAIFDGNQVATTRVYSGVAIEGGLTPLELLYWDEGSKAVLRVEFKLSGDLDSSYKVLGSGTLPLFSDVNAPVLTELQDIVTGARPGSYAVRTGSLLQGGAGDDQLTGGDARDHLIGDDGRDVLAGGAASDVIEGGQGDDLLTGDLPGGMSNDVFRWSLGDASSTATPAHDVISDFDNTSYAGDVLDLRDLLTGETHAANTTTLPNPIGLNNALTITSDAGNLADYLHFTKVGSDTVIEISSEGKFTAGSHAAVDQVITLTGVNLVGSFTNDNQVINDLLARGKLITDVA